MGRESGEELLHYRLVEKIGQGAMGSVWRAEDTTLDRDTAIKILPDEFAEDAQFLARFEREAKLLASLNHPNVTQVFGVHNADNTRFLAMELVPGEDLSERLARGPLPVAEAIRILVPIADALEAAHDKGVIHRDLKPANVKLTPEGRVKVLDFGLAKSVAGDPRRGSSSDAVDATLTNVGAVLGTVPYMSPEQARGRPLDMRTDVWSFGCVAWECLTGKRPFERETIPDQLSAILNEEPDWAQLPANARASVVRMLRRCLAKSRRQRLHHIADARLELEDADVSEPTTGRAVPRPARSPFQWVALGVVLVAFMALMIFGPFARKERTGLVGAGVLANARFTRITNFEGDELDAAISRDGNYVAFLSDRDGPAQFDVYVGRIGSGVVTNLSRANPDVSVLAPKSFVRHLGFLPQGDGLWLIGGGQGTLKAKQVQPLVGRSQIRQWLDLGTIHVDWSRDGSRFVYSLDHGGDPVFVNDAAESAPAEEVKGSYPGFHQHFPTWTRAPGEDWIYLVRGIPATGGMHLFRMRSNGSDLQELVTDKRNVMYPTPLDARTVLFVAEELDGSGPWLWELDVETGKTRRAALGVERYLSLAASRDGRRLVATVANPGIALHTVAIPPKGEMATEDDVKDHEVEAVRALSPRARGDALYYLSSVGGGDGLWVHRDGAPPQELWDPTRGPLLEPPAISPDGSRIALVVRKPERRLVVVNADGTNTDFRLDDIEVLGAASWSPNGEWIAIGGTKDDEPGLFKVHVEDGTVARLFEGQAVNPLWSPDDSMIVFAGKQVGYVSRLLGVTPDRKPIDLPEIPTRPFGDNARFLPDGSGLVYRKGVDPELQFYLYDLETNTHRQLTNVSSSALQRNFDITPDGKTIIFDREIYNSDIVLIERDPK